MSQPDAPRGAIRSEQAYALGKMLDHSSWQRGEKIVRLITPSDIDVCFDNDGKIIFCEFSSEHTTWRDLHGGQRRLYENCIKGGPHCAVLCKHSVKPTDGRAINSRADVESFQVMLYDYQIVYAPVWPNKDATWDRYVLSWFEDPLAARRRCLGKALV